MTTGRINQVAVRYPKVIPHPGKGGRARDQGCREQTRFQNSLLGTEVQATTDKISHPDQYFLSEAKRHILTDSGAYIYELDI